MSTRPGGGQDQGPPGDAAKMTPPQKAPAKTSKKTSKKTTKKAPGTEVPDTRTNQLVDEAALAGLTKWVAAGFATLSGLATFFGVKDGNLDAVVREHPDDVRFIALLIGGGVVFALVSSALVDKKPIRFLTVVLACSALIAFSSIAFANFASDAGDKPTPGIDWPSGKFWFWLVVVTFVVSVLFSRTKTSLVAAGLVFSLVAVSIGLLGATKLAIGSKLGPSATQVVGKVVHGDKLSSVEVALKASWLEPNSTVVVEVYGVDPEGEASEEALGTAELQSTSTGSLDTTASFPVRRQDWAGFSIRTCSTADAASTSAGCEEDDERSRLASGDGSATLDRVEASLTPGADGLVATFAVTGPENVSTQVRVFLRYEQKGKKVTKTLAKAYLAPDADGKQSWSSTVSVAEKQKGRVVTTYRACPMDEMEPCEKPRVIARLRLSP